MTPFALDIETIPDQRPGALDEFLQAAKDDFKAPSTLTKEQAAKDLGLTDASDIKFTSKDAMIARWVEAFKEIKGPEVAEEAWRKTALDGARGQVLMIGTAIEDDEPVVFHEGNERDTLARFFEEITRSSLRNNGGLSQFIGHNVIGFDLKFIYHRAVILGVKPHHHFPIHPKGWDECVFDTMTRWAGHGNRISLDDLCKALGLPGKGEIDGSMVWDMYRDGKIGELLQYCADDVTKTREVWRRLQFLPMPVTANQDELLLV